MFKWNNHGPLLNFGWPDLGIDLKSLIIGRSGLRLNKNCHMTTWSENVSINWLALAELDLDLWTFLWKSCQVWCGRGLKGLAVSGHKYIFLDKSMIANVLTNQWRLASEITWTPHRSWLMTFFNSFPGPSMAADESQLEVIAALPTTKHGHLFVVNSRLW